MSNLSLLARLFAAGDAGDLDAFDHYLHEDVVVHAPAGLSTVGLESERESWRKARSAIADLHHQFIDVFSSPTAEAARCVVTGTMRGSYGGFSSEGHSFRMDQAVFAHVRDGKITELWEIVDTAVLREQLGEPGRQASGALANNALADGYLSKGCGIAIANLRETTADQFQKSYNASRHPIFNTLMTAGPLSLTREAQELGYVIEPDYADKCQLCQQARESLVSRYPDYLTPTQHYQIQ